MQTPLKLVIAVAVALNSALRSPMAVIVAPQSCQNGKNIAEQPVEHVGGGPFGQGMSEQQAVENIESRLEISGKHWTDSELQMSRRAAMVGRSSATRGLSMQSIIPGGPVMFLKTQYLRFPTSTSTVVS